MKLIEREVLRNITKRGSRWTMEDITLQNCVFENCWIQMRRWGWRWWQSRPMIRNVVLRDCELIGGGLEALTVEDTLVDGFRTHGLFVTRAATFRHVKFLGKIRGPIILSNSAPYLGKREPHYAQVVAEQNTNYYANVDWALDISEAEFEELDIRGIPARVIRRDPETQAVVRRANAIDQGWRRLNLSGECEVGMKMLLDFGWDDITFVAGKLDPDFPILLKDLQRLRDAGIAEPD